MRYLQILLLALFFPASAVVALSVIPNPAADIIGVDGDVIGELKLIDSPHGVLLHVRIFRGGLAPGVHGLHLHSVGDCSDVGAFKRSKSHINVAGKQHGLLNPEGPDNADLPNLRVAGDGSANAEMFNWRVRMWEGDAALRDEDGSALVIHLSRDDHMSQPIGGAGPRVACAVINR